MGKKLKKQIKQIETELKRLHWSLRRLEQGIDTHPPKVNFERTWDLFYEFTGIGTTKPRPWVGRTWTLLGDYAGLLDGMSIIFDFPPSGGFRACVVIRRPYATAEAHLLPDPRLDDLDLIDRFYFEQALNEAYRRAWSKIVIERERLTLEGAGGC